MSFLLDRFEKINDFFQNVWVTRLVAYLVDILTMDAAT